MDYSNKTVTTTSASMFSVGGTYIEFYWNFARIYLSAYTINYIIQALEAIVSRVLVNYPTVNLVFQIIANSGVFYVKNGIWFDFNYYYAAIGGMAALATGNPWLFSLSITAAGWQ